MTCGTQIGGIKEIWRRHILWFCVPILNKLSQLYALDLIQLLSVFPPGCLASWHRVFFVRVIQLEGAISPSGVAWREEPNQAGPWGGKFQVKILVPKKCDFEIKKLQSQTLAEHPGNQAFNECFLKLETVKLRKKKNYTHNSKNITNWNLLSQVQSNLANRILLRQQTCVETHLEGLPIFDWTMIALSTQVTHCQKKHIHRFPDRVINHLKHQSSRCFLLYRLVTSFFNFMSKKKHALLCLIKVA